jgi:hypothetical protein
MTTTPPHCASRILMVCPKDFAFNEQTAVDNEFQKKPTQSQEELRKKAIDEYHKLVTALRENHVEVISIEDPCKVTIDGKEVPTPDAVFPNNWISTDSNGRVFLYQMKTDNRNAERQRCSQVLEHFKDLKVTEVIDLTKESKQVLEGTGAMVIDHKNKMVYVALSERAREEPLKIYAEKMGYKYTTFNTKSSSGKEYYHTNVVMSIGEDFVIVCADCVATDESRKALLDQLKKAKKDVITITCEQVEKYFCGNVLQVKNTKGENLIAMSETAYKGYTKEQLQVLEKHGKIVKVDISTIEHVGGGSVRCMMAEVFLPTKN